MDGSHSELISMINELRKLSKGEDEEKEVPVVYGGFAGLEDVPDPDPDALIKESEEVIRQKLNRIVANIFKETDVKKRDCEYQLFLNKYERAIHGSWYVSTSGGSKFLGYSVVREVAGGAFGTVYEAEDVNGNKIAIKVLKPENFKKIEFYKNFRRGVNSLKIITNRNINGVVEFSDASEIPPTLIMQWIDGPSLQNLVSAQQIVDWFIRLKIGLELSSILINSHGVPERVYHRDLRPANVMVSDFYADQDSWKVVVLDFDLSWHKGAEDSSIMHSPALGYLAPEQRRKVEGQNTRSALVDSYGFGMTFYYMCSGIHPFPDQHCLPNWEKTVEEACGKLSCKEWRSLPRVVARLVLNATQEKQHARWSMSQINGELESLNNAINGSGRVSGENIVEELAFNVKNMFGYIWSNDDSSAAYIGINGLKAVLRYKYESYLVEFELVWEYMGDQDWNRVERALSSGFDKIIATLKGFGWDIVSDRRSRGFSVMATLDSEFILNNMLKSIESVDKAISHASNISGF